MNVNTSATKPERIYRVDKFSVPERARDEVISRVRETHALLKTLPGFVQDFVLEQSSGSGQFNFVTIVEWEDAQSMVNAKAAVTAMHKELNFNPQEMYARLGISAELGLYKRIDA
jgi:heme-degrading monooxygenase HmoA